MSFIYGPPLLSGAFNFGPGSFGVLGSAVASDGIDGPGYIYPSLSLPADAGKEYFGWITTQPDQGTLTINPLDFSFTWTGLTQGSHSFGFTVVEDGVVQTPERYVYADVDVVRQISGSVTLADTTASGGMFVAAVAVYGTAALDDVDASGDIVAINPSTMSGTVDLDATIATGLLKIELDETPLTPGELRQMYNWVRDLHMIHGLQNGTPLVVSPISRVAGSISQLITDDNGTTTVSRTT